MSELKSIVSQISNLEISYKSEGDTSLHRCAFLADMFGVDLHKSDYTSFTELKSHLQSVALTDEQDLLVDTMNKLNNIEIVLKNYNGELKTIPTNVLSIEDLDYIVNGVEFFTKDNSRSINANYLTDAMVKREISKCITMNERDLSRKTPHTELGISVGGLLTDTYTTDEKGSALTILVKDKLHKVWNKPFFTFQATSDVKSLTKSIKTDSESKAKTLKKILNLMIKNQLAVRDELFIVVSKEDLTKEGNNTTIQLKLGRSKLESKNNLEVVKGLLYRTNAIIPNPMTTVNQEAWVVVL